MEEKTKKKRSGYILATASLWVGFMFLHGGFASAFITLFLIILISIAINDRF